MNEEEKKNKIKKIENLNKRIADSPNAENYLDLSLAYYKAGLYVECIDACDKALAIKPDYNLAYNNICSAYCNLKEWDKAIAACEKALVISPDYQLAKNNLKWAQSGKANSSRAP